MPNERHLLIPLGPSGKVCIIPNNERSAEEKVFGKYMQGSPRIGYRIIRIEIVLNVSVRVSPAADIRRISYYKSKRSKSWFAWKICFCSPLISSWIVLQKIIRDAGLRTRPRWVGLTQSGIALRPNRKTHAGSAC